MRKMSSGDSLERDARVRNDVVVGLQERYRESWYNKAVERERGYCSEKERWIIVGKGGS